MNNSELKIMVPNGWIVNEEVMSDGSRVFTVKPDTATANDSVPTVEPEATAITDDTACHQQKGIFKKVPASELRLDDEFLKHQPKTEKEKRFKDRVETAIKSGLKDFWHPVYDPSFYDNGRIYYDERICYEPGKKPAVGKKYDWWKKTAEKYAPERGSRLGTKSEYIAFLAVLIKELVASGKTVEWAWNAVCNDSKELGNYYGNNNNGFEATGSREVCGWYDLANTNKILTEDKEDGELLLAGGYYYDFSSYCQLSSVAPTFGRYNVSFYGCGWLVFDSCPEC